MLMIIDEEGAFSCFMREFVMFIRRKQNKVGTYKDAQKSISIDTK